jgi:hypothetical protein
MKHALFLVAATACSTSVTTAQYDDVARSIASSAAGDTAAMLDVIAIAQGDPPPGFAPDDSGAIDGSRGALDYSYLITCKDAGGTAPGACGATSALANVTYEWSGSNALPAQIVREGQWTASGLQSATVQIEGDAEFVDDATIDTASYHFDATATYTAVTIDLASQQATGGSIALELAASTDASAFSVSADVAIAAGTAGIVLDGTHDYTADLATGEVTSGESP